MRRRYATTASNLLVALMVLRSRRGGIGGADPPTGLNRTMTFSCANVVPTSASAAAASRGRCVSTSEAVIVSGRSGEGDRSRSGSGMSGVAGPDPGAAAAAPWAAAAAGAGEEVDGVRGGDDIVSCVGVPVTWGFRSGYGSGGKLRVMTRGQPGRKSFGSRGIWRVDELEGARG